MRRFLLIILLCVAQVIGAQDTAQQTAQATAQYTAYDTALVRPIMRAHPYFSVAGPLTPLRAESIHEVAGKELLFYGLLGLYFVIALIRLSFPKYFNDLFRLFFRTTIRQRHLSEQMSQSPLPSFLLNAIFFIAAGLYLSLWISYEEQNPFNNFSWLLLYVCLGIMGAYLLKYVTLQLTGWLFRAREAAESYTFTVFTINKMVGLFLLPFLVLMAFSKDSFFEVVLTVSWCMLAGFLLYRVLLTYRVVRKQISLSGFHFLLYVAGFEISPLLVLYKLLLLKFG